MGLRRVYIGTKGGGIRFRPILRYIMILKRKMRKVGKKRREEREEEEEEEKTFGHRFVVQ